MADIKTLVEDYAQAVSEVDLMRGEVWRSESYRLKRIAECDAARAAVNAALDALAEAHQAEVARLTDDRDSWCQQASARTEDAVRFAGERDAVRAEVARLTRELKEVRRDAEKWAAWIESQRLIEEEMPEGYRVILECSPGDWSLEFCDPDCERIRIDDYESTEDFIRAAVEVAKERAALAGASGAAGEGAEQ